LFDIGSTIGDDYMLQCKSESCYCRRLWKKLPKLAEPGDWPWSVSLWIWRELDVTLSLWNVSDFRLKQAPTWGLGRCNPKFLLPQKCVWPQSINQSINKIC